MMDLQKLNLMFDTLFSDPDIEEKFWDWYTNRNKKQPTMTPEQKKAKEIVEKYREIILSKIEGSGEILAAKACAIEEVNAVIEENKSVLQMLERHGSERSMLPVRFRIQDLEQVLTEIEKL